LDNDQTFKTYAVTLIGAAVLLLATLLTLGIAGAPTPFFFAEHVVMGLMIRAAYKSFDGPGWAIPGLGISDAVEQAPAAPADAIPSAG
jgi:hypothetical protein